MNDKIMFYVINEEGIREDAQILAKYRLSNMNDYITYTYGEINDNNMIKIYSTGVTNENGNYSYREIVSNDEWNEIKEVMKYIARDENEPIAEKYKSNLKLKGEEVSIRKPKKLLVSKKFADTLASKYSEDDESSVESLTNVNVESALNTPAEFILNQGIEPEKEDILSKTIEIPTFEELQARNKNIENVITNSKIENKVDIPVSLETFKVPAEESKKIVDEIPSLSQKKDYKEKFKEEVEPLLMDVYAKQMKHIEELEEELSKTKFDLFEKQKEALSLKKEKEELEGQSSILKEELNGVQEKMNGILNVIQGTNDNKD
ncbi:MAG: hypothetical protein J6J17_04465 [Bacilli bacterium]|nr:hypothetical protein [Bacilli bacterium]